MTVLIFSQPTLPKKIIIDGFPAIAISYDQMNDINLTYVRATRFEQISDSLQSAIKIADELYKKTIALISGYEAEIKTQSLVIKDERERGNLYKSQYEQEQKKTRKQKLTTGLIGGGLGAIALGLLIGLLVK